MVGAYVTMLELEAEEFETLEMLRPTYRREAGTRNVSSLAAS